MSTLTEKSIQEAIDLMTQDCFLYGQGFSRAYGNPFKFQGIDIHEVKVTQVPIVQVREDFEWLTDEARERINKRLIQLLGYKDTSPIQPGIAYMFDNKVVMRSDDCAVMLDTTA